MKLSRHTYNVFFVLLTAFSSVFLHVISIHVPQQLILFSSTLLAFLYFHLVNVHKLGEIYLSAWQHKFAWLMLMVTITVMWVSTFFGSILSPNIFIVLYFVIASVLAFGVNIFTESSALLRAVYLVGAIGLLVCVTLLFLEFMKFEQHLAGFDKWLLVIYGCLGGLSAFAYRKQSYSFAQKANLSSTQILAIRFWLLVILSFLLVSHHDWVALAVPDNIVRIVAVTVITLILPLYVFQKGLMAAGPEASAILCGIIPVVTYLLQITIMNQPFYFGIFVLNALVTFFLIFPSLFFKIIRK